MMSSLQPVRGTHDWLPDTARLYRHVTETARSAALRYGFDEIVTPIFEFSEVFSRTLGDTSDIVTKEMYSFEDRGGDKLTLRPEGTAGVARAFISGGLAQNLPLKFFYAGPMFRYERPQKGRLRQFHQTGIELLGIADPQADIEVIACGAAVLRDLGILDRTMLELNSLGDAETRLAYREALVAYLSNYEAELSADSRMRLHRNPLRVLDSKDEGDRKIIVGAPLNGSYMTDTARAFYDAVRNGLTKLGIAYREEPSLVRGLDYYCHTCFEFTAAELGAQKTVLAGGRYDGLIKLMGGPETPGIGWASGIERTALMLAPQPLHQRPIALIPVGEEAETKAPLLAETLRRAGWSVDLGYGGNLSKRMKRANKINARLALILGDDELVRDVVTLRNLDSGAQQEIPLALLPDALKSYR